MNDHLIGRFNQAVPRYTSYPTVPHWTLKEPDTEVWISHVNDEITKDPQISIYIHLPFCEKLCTYCGCNKRITKNHGVEESYIETILAEWDNYVNHMDVTPTLVELHLGGGTPTFFSPANLERLIGTLLKDVHISKERSFSFEAHPSSTTYEHLAFLYQLGFTRLSIGVQDVSEKILKKINRFQTTEQVIRATQTARELGYDSVNFDIIYGLPFQEKKHIAQTIQLISELLPDRIAFYSYAHVPWKSKGQRAFTHDDIATGLRKYELKCLGHELLTDAGYHPIGMDHYALPEDSLYRALKKKRLHRNFMGYTDQKPKVLLGLGCSAISETSEMYVQNVKEVEAYASGIHSDGLALLKGHILTREEKLVKQLITELFCQGKASWDKNSGVSELLNSKELTDLKREKLVQVDETSIEITYAGKDFVRNICACLDPRFEFEGSANQFSSAG